MSFKYSTNWMVSISALKSTKLFSVEIEVSVSVCGRVRSAVRDVISSAEFEYVMKVRDVADRQPQNLNLRQFLVGRKCRQKFPQFGKRHVKSFDSDALARRMRNAIFQRRATPPTSLLARQVSSYFDFRFRLRVRRTIAGRSDAPARIHRLVGFDHVTTGSGGNDDVSIVWSFAGGVSHGYSGLMKEGRIRWDGNNNILWVQVQRRVRQIVVVVAIETTVVVVIVVIIMLIKQLLLLVVMMMMMMMGVRHLWVNWWRQSWSHPHSATDDVQYAMADSWLCLSILLLAPIEHTEQCLIATCMQLIVIACHVQLMFYCN